MLVLALAACSDKKDDKDDSTVDFEAAKGGVGEPCTKNGDCKTGLYCLDKVCTERSDQDDDTVTASEEFLGEEGFGINQGGWGKPGRSLHFRIIIVGIHETVHDGRFHEGKLHLPPCVEYGAVGLAVIGNRKQSLEHQRISR